MSDTSIASVETAVRPFRVEIPEQELEELRRRIDATRWPTMELVADRSQGVQLAATQELARYWTTEYDWRKCEARLNALPQFKTQIDGLNIHFIHVKSAHENALPLIMTHGWPGSIIELLETIGPLTDPTAHGGNEEDAFHLVLPSIPGYGFSDEPTEVGWGPIRIGRAWHELMRRLGYTRYVAQGGDVGSQVTDAMGRLSLDGLLGIHTNLLTPALGDAHALSASPPTKEERAALDQLDTFHASGTGYFVEQATRPETIGYALLDSPIALAAWIMDHDTDSYEKIARAFVDKQPSGNLTREHIVDNITLYWLTGTGASAARSYWEEEQENARAAGQAATPVSVPVGFTTFPGEIWRTPRSWVERAYPNVAVYFNEVDKGGHFAAWEEPQLFSEEMRAGVQAAALTEDSQEPRCFSSRTPPAKRPYCSASPTTPGNAHTNWRRRPSSRGICLSAPSASAHTQPLSRSGTCGSMTVTDELLSGPNDALAVSAPPDPVREPPASSPRHWGSEWCLRLPASRGPRFGARGVFALRPSRGTTPPEDAPVVPLPTAASASPPPHTRHSSRAAG